jgi:voltage-gated potassium channel
MSKEQPLLQEDIRKERQALLEQLQDWLETPMVVLAFFWLALFVAEVIWGLTPFLTVTGYVIWILFVAEFAVDLTLAPSKRRYLQHNWLKGLALLAPALRVFRIFRLLRLFRAAGMTRGLRLLRVLSSLNRGMRALAASMGRRGFGYVVMLTLIVVLVGAAGMYAFESEAPGAQGLDNYGDALWWTAMIMTTLGSEYWPQTAAGRALCLFLSLYAFAIFGYVTATLATFFIGSDAEDEEAAQLASAKAIAALHREVAALGEEIRALKS